MATVNTSISETTTLIPHPQYYHQFQIIHGVLVTISHPYIILISLIGIITNTSTVVLLSKNYITKSLKNQWTLIALALSDLLFNFALLIRVIHDIMKFNSERMCLIISFLSHLAELLSACYTVSFTIQRYVAVRYPIKMAIHRHSSPLISLSIIFILCTIFCFILSHSNTYEDCHEELQLSWFISDALFSFIIPFSLILICNILIVSFIRQHSRSQISVQSTLLRKKKPFIIKYRTDQRDETFITDHNINPHVDENIELKSRKADTLSSVEIGHHVRRNSDTSFLEQVTSDVPSPQSQRRSTFRLSNLSKKNSCSKTISPSHDSFVYRLSAKSSSQSNEKELFANISSRTSQSIRVTRMLIVVSTCFLIFNAPAHLCVIALKFYTVINAPILNDRIDGNQQHHHHHQSQMNSTVYIPEFHNGTINNTISSLYPHGRIIDDEITIHIFYMSVLLTQLISYASYSINFFLYSFSGIAFRTSLRQLFHKLRWS